MNYLINLMMLFFLVIFSVEAQYSETAITYLGQKIPGNNPELFAPGIVSTGADENSLEISPSGDEIVFIRNGNVMLITKNSDGSWGDPVIAPFSGKYTDKQAFYSPDGQKIYFMSDRPALHAKFKFNLWVTEKQGELWAAVPLLIRIKNKAELQSPGIAANGNIYDNGIVQFINSMGKYQPKETAITPENGINPFISPDENYMIFAARQNSKDNTDLFISYRKSDKTWSKGISFGDAINTAQNEGSPFVTADGKYLFFSRNSDIYWVSAKLISILAQNRF